VAVPGEDVAIDLQQVHPVREVRLEGPAGHGTS